MVHVIAWNEGQNWQELRRWLIIMLEELRVLWDFFLVPSNSITRKSFPFFCKVVLVLHMLSDPTETWQKVNTFPIQCGCWFFPGKGHGLYDPDATLCNSPNWRDVAPCKQHANDFPGIVFNHFLALYLFKSHVLCIFSAIHVFVLYSL